MSYIERQCMSENWLKTAVEAEQAQQGQQAPQAAQTDGQQHGNAPTPSTNKPAMNPQPTQTPAQKAQAGKQQMAQMDAIRNVVLPDAARRALPALNQSLYFLMNELVSRDDLHLNESAARTLAIEIMSVWLEASRNGGVSDLGSIVAKSPAIGQSIGAA